MQEQVKDLIAALAGLGAGEEDVAVQAAEETARKNPRAIALHLELLENLIIKSNGAASGWIGFGLENSVVGRQLLDGKVKVNGNVHIIDYLASLSNVRMDLFCRGLLDENIYGNEAAHRGAQNLMLDRGKLARKLLKTGTPESVKVLTEKMVHCKLGNRELILAILRSDHTRQEKIIIGENDAVETDNPNFPFRNANCLTAFLAAASRHIEVANCLTTKQSIHIEGIKPNPQDNDGLLIHKYRDVTQYSASVMVHMLLRHNLPDKLAAYMQTMPAAKMPNIFNGYYGVPDPADCSRLIELLNTEQAGWAADCLLAHGRDKLCWNNGKLARQLKEKNESLSDRLNEFITRPSETAARVFQAVQSLSELQTRVA